MNQRNTIIVFIAITALLVAACGGPQARNDRTVSFIGGNGGVNIGLINGVPPAAVYDGGRMDFGVGVVLENVGESDLGPTTDNPFARVSLEGFLPAAFGMTPAQMSQDLDRPLLGAHKNFDGSILPGQMHNLVFSPLNYRERLQGNRVYTFLIKFCYDYESIATVPICFKNSMIENVQDAQICTLTGEKYPQNSGAPLHVTSVVQNPLAPYKVMVNFVIEHAGTGEFYGRTAGETCDPTITNSNKYRVDVAVSSEDPGLNIQCSTLGGDAAGTITMFQGAPQTVTCTLTGDAASASRIYTDLLTVNLQYRYGESIAQPIVINAVGSAD